jgi:hypothetical protein
MNAEDDRERSHAEKSEHKGERESIRDDSKRERKVRREEREQKKRNEKRQHIGDVGSTHAPLRRAIWVARDFEVWN